MIPLVHDFTDATVLVFGGGSVGARKARRFDREARVVVIAPTFGAHDFGDAELIRAAPEPAVVCDWIDRFDPVLVIAATDDGAVNEAIEAECRDRSVLVNRADRRGRRGPGSVVVPATVRDDPVVVAFSTSGSSPALSAHLREQFERKLDGTGAMATLTADVHEELKAQGWSADDRQHALRNLVESEELWKVLRSGDVKPQQVFRDVMDEVHRFDGGNYS